MFIKKFQNRYENKIVLLKVTVWKNLLWLEMITFYSAKQYNISQMVQDSLLKTRDSKM